MRRNNIGDDNITFCLETRLALIDSCQHWQRMIDFVKKDFMFRMNVKVDGDYLLEQIGESVYESHCALCKRFESFTYGYGGRIKDCSRFEKAVNELCPLSLIHETCCWHWSAYDRVVCSESARMWLKNANRLYNILYDFLTVPFTTA